MWNSHLFSVQGWHLCTQGQVPLSWKIILVLHKKISKKDSWSTLGMTFLVAPGRVFLLQPQQPPVASHRDMLIIKFAIASHHTMGLTIAITPLTLNGDMMIFPGSSFNCWYSRLPNTWDKKSIAEVENLRSRHALFVIKVKHKTNRVPLGHRGHLVDRADLVRHH